MCWLPMLTMLAALVLIEAHAWRSQMETAVKARVDTCSAPLAVRIKVSKAVWAIELKSTLMVVMAGLIMDPRMTSSKPVIEKRSGNGILRALSSFIKLVAMPSQSQAMAVKSSK